MEMQFELEVMLRFTDAQTREMGHSEMTQLKQEIANLQKRIKEGGYSMITE